MKIHFAAALVVALGLTACASGVPPIKRENVFRVYFNTNETKLDLGDQDVIYKAAQAYKKGGQEIILAGHADRSGAKEINTALSKARAINVTAALVANGVPRERVVTRYFGESAPLVAPGQDGVSSKDNRRVLMIVR